MAEAGPYVLTAEEHGLLRDAETADELEAEARKVRARWIAEALEELADEYAPTVQPDGYLSGTAIGSATLRGLAAEYRAGTR